MAELYLFKDVNTYTGFTPTITNKIFNGITYQATIVKRNALNITDNFNKSTVVFTFTASNSFAQYLLINDFEVPVQVTVYKNSDIYWQGQVLSASRVSLIAIEITCDSNYTLAIKQGMQYKTMLHCNHTLYSPTCGVVQESWVTHGTTTANSVVLVIPELTQADGYFNNGKVIMQNQTRRIIGHVGTTISLASPFSKVMSGAISVYPGCNLTSVNCNSFNNLANGLMFEHMAEHNPFGSEGLL